MKWHSKLIAAVAVLAVTVVSFSLLKGSAAATPAYVQDILVSNCPGIPPGGSAAVGFIYPNPSTVLASDGGTNLYSVLHVCAGSSAWGISGNLRMYNVTRTVGGGTLNIGDFTFPTTIAPNSGNGTGPDSPPVFVTFNGLTPGYNCWSFSMDMAIQGWGPSTIGGNSLCIEYTPPDNPPIGAVGINCSVISGWAHDPDAAQRALRLTVHIYIDGAFYRSVVAGSDPNHDNFSIPFPLKDSAVHRVQVYAINPTPFGVNPGIGDVQVGPCDQPPIGDINSVTCDAITGWAFDPDFPTAPIEIHMYVDGPAGTGTYDGPYRANLPRPDVNRVYPVTGSSNHGFSIDISRYKDAAPRTFYFYAIGTSSASGSQDRNRTNTLLGSRTLGPCATPTCTVMTSANPVEVNKPFSITLNYNYSGGPRGRNISPKGSVSFNGGPTATNVYPSSNGATGSWLVGTNFTAPAAGTYSISARITASGAPGTVGEYTYNCPKGDLNVANLPYLKVFGNDVAAGGKFADTGAKSCSANATQATGQPPASIWAFNKKVVANGGGSGTYYGGASGQFGALALGQIVSFNTAGNRNGLSPPTTPNDLSFGNMIKSGATQVRTGENQTGSSGIYRCIPDYFSTSSNLPKPGATMLPPNSTIGLTSVPDGAQNVTYVDGDVYISNNITYSNTSWGDTKLIPSYYLIARGNIYIGSNVTQLDGVYVAQPKAGVSSSGTIYTCTAGVRALYGTTGIHDSCLRNLTVTGAFIANSVKFQRTRGTVENSIPNTVAPTPALTLSYSSAGAPSGSCFLIDEPGEVAATTWYDNVLCSSSPELYWAKYPGIDPVNPGFKKRATDICLSFASHHSNDGIWLDNQLCWQPSADLQLTWSNTNASSATKSCILIFESQDPRWDPNSWLCAPIPGAPVYAVQNEVPTFVPGGLAGNIAETFNFSQELYLAPVPAILDSVTGGGTNSNVYQSITSLPPIL